MPVPKSASRYEGADLREEQAWHGCGQPPVLLFVTRTSARHRERRGRRCGEDRDCGARGVLQVELSNARSTGDSYGKCGHVGHGSLDQNTNGTKGLEKGNKPPYLE